MFSVSDPITHHVVSDVKEDVAQHKDSESSEPITSFKASIDIPGNLFEMHYMGRRCLFPPDK